MPIAQHQLAITRAMDLCQSSSTEMTWLQVLIAESKSDPYFNGPIYAVPLADRVIFVHQPYVMSCLGCLLYDCGGNVVERSEVDLEALVSGMTDSNMIYNPFE
jgi:hypothetical protein